jgi:hypothetical protein
MCRVAGTRCPERCLKALEAAVDRLNSAIGAFKAERVKRRHKKIVNLLHLVYNRSLLIAKKPNHRYYRFQLVGKHII